MTPRVSIVVPAYNEGPKVAPFLDPIITWNGQPLVDVSTTAGKDTFVGQFAELAGSFASGDTLVHLQSGSTTKVPDRFLLCALRQNRAAQKAGMLARLGELCNKTEGHLLWKHLLLNKES